MPEHRVTFGVQYAHEPHPTLPDIAHPDGWLTVVAPDEEVARMLTVALCGTAWSNLYPEPWDPDEWAHYYPRGELLRVALP